MNTSFFHVRLVATLDRLRLNKVDLADDEELLELLKETVIFQNTISGDDLPVIWVQLLKLLKVTLNIRLSSWN